MNASRTCLIAVATLGCATTPAPAPTCPDVPPAPPPAVTPAPPTPAPAPPDAPATPGYSGLGADSVSAETIARFAPPPLDPSVSRRIQAMLDVRGSGGGALTRDGKRMFFTWSVTGTPQVWRQDGPMAFPVQLTGGEDRTAVAAVAPDDSFVVVSRDVGGQENPGLYLLAPTGGALTPIQHLPKVQTALQFIADDARSLVFTANDVDPASYAIYRWDVASRQRTRVFDQPGLWSIEDHRGHGADEQWLLSRALGNTHVELYRYQVATGALTPLIGQGVADEYDARFGAGDDIVVRTNQPGDFQRLYLLGTGGALTPIGPEVPHDVEGFTVDEARTRIYYVINDGGFFKAGVLDARTRKPIALPALPAADNTTIGAVSRDGRYVQLAVNGSRLPTTIVVYDWRTRKATRWRVPSTPEVDVGTFAQVQLDSYPARDGTRIPMLVHRSAACATAVCPVIVMFHGGPEGQATAGFSPYAQLFVDAGFVLVEPNVRGSSGYGKAWLHADDAAKRKDVITDLEDVARYLRTAWAKDGVAPKIGVTGGSYGGYATLMAMTYFAGAYDAGVAEVGMSNLVTFIRNTAPYRRILRASEYGDPDQLEAVMTELSPITHVAKVKAPLLVIQGVNDPRVPVGEALQIHAALEAKGVPGGLILFADEGHGTAKRGNQVLSIGHTIAFFEKHLK